MGKQIPTQDLSTATSQDLYQKRVKTYPRQIKGRFSRLSDLTIWITLGLYFALPWLRFEGHPAILFNIADREFLILNMTFWPQDFILLSWGLIIAAFALFFVTTFAGRVWCGYTCPQTVWIKLFTFVEEITEGNRQQRIKLDAAPLSIKKIAKKSSKHFLWLLISLITGYTFVGYFVPIQTLLYRLDQLITLWPVFWIGFFTLMTYMNAGWLREQVCIYMCPYARFQSAMFDADTLIVSYDEERGEPRKRSHQEDPQAADGACIDCQMCVQVCPTGIDIRDGLQLECIGCAACVDACDQVMDKIQEPRGLVRYTTQNILQGKLTRLFRPKLIGYGIVLSLMGIAWIAALALRVPLELDIIRDRGSLYQITPANQIQNRYNLALANMTQDPQTYELRLADSRPFIWQGEQSITVPPGEVISFPMTLEISTEGFAKGSNTINIEVKQLNSRYKVIEESRFLTPPPKER